MRGKLNAPMPNEAITQHPSKTYLSTIKAIYITERLNDVFGIGGWNLYHEIISDTDKYVVVKGHIAASWGDGKYEILTPEQYGGGAKRDADIADAYKSAVTDCQSKCASYLEIGIDVFKGLHTHNKQPTKTTQKATQKSYPQSDYSGDKPLTGEITKPQKGKLWAMMKNGGMDDKQASAFFAFKNPTTKDAASDFIENFDAYLNEYMESLDGK